MGGGTNAKRFSIIYHITVWGIGELANWRPCLVRRCRAQKLCEKWNGGGGAVHLSQMERTRRGGDPLSGLKSHLDFLPNNAHFIHNKKKKNMPIICKFSVFLNCVKWLIQIGNPKCLCGLVLTSGRE